MDNELREAVARAICDSTEADIFDDLAEQSIYRAVYLQQADAAIATVMEAPKILSALAQAADAGRYKEAYFAEREDNLWNAYYSGHVKDGRWSHLFMSDGEWLARECGFDPCDPDYDDAEIRAAIPTIARQALQGEA